VLGRNRRERVHLLVVMVDVIRFADGKNALLDKNYGSGKRALTWGRTRQSAISIAGAGRQRLRRVED
jgi:hypothetical protein